MLACLHACRFLGGVFGVLGVVLCPCVGVLACMHASGFAGALVGVLVAGAGGAPAACSVAWPGGEVPTALEGP